MNEGDGGEPAGPTPPGLKRHPRLFRVLGVAFGLWIAALLVLYFKTVYPLRHPAGTRPGNVAVPQ